MTSMISTSALDPDDPASPFDLDGRVVSGIEALRQRVIQRLRFQRGTWPLNPAAGSDTVFGHQVGPTLAAQIITATIRDEGRDEVSGVTDVEVNVDASTRRLNYSARVLTVYGDLEIADAIS